MTDILERARAALEGTTPGPWRDGNVKEGCIFDADSLPVAYYVSRRNRRFIATARQLVPEMAAEIERLRAALSHTAEQALAAEIPVGYGPEDKGQWTRGYDAAIRHARKALEGKK